MAKLRGNLETAAGKLISAIQKEWGVELGSPQAEESENIMNKAHDLLQASKSGNIKQLLNGSTIHEYFGESWIERHQSVNKAILAFEAEIKGNDHV